MASRTPRTPYAPHDLGDVAGLVRGGRVLIGGHAFLVKDLRCDHTGRVRCGPGGGAAEIVEKLDEATLTLVHADWEHCPSSGPARREARRPEPEACDPPAGDSVAVPRQALVGLVKVARYVSLGRGAVGHQPDGAPYPDYTARWALGALDDAGIEVDGDDDA